MRRPALPRRPLRTAVPDELVAEVRQALADVDTAREQAARAAGSSGVALAWRREAEAAVERAYQRADVLLREATRRARLHSYFAWSQWRSELSWFDQQRQARQLAVADRPAMLRLGSVRAIDTGMGKPHIGEMAHGESKPAGTPPRYGIDLEQVLHDTDALPGVAEQLAARRTGRIPADLGRRVSRGTAAARSAAPAPTAAAGDLPPAA